MERLQLVSRETAILAKNKGFNWKCFWHITEDSDLKGTGYFSANKRGGIDLPEQALLQKWLREEHDILVLIDTDFFNLIWKIIIPDHELPQKIISEKNFNTYEEALEIALQESLKLIE